MTWYAASVIMSARFLDGNQDKYPIYENVILIEASNEEEALVKIKARAREDEIDSSGNLTWCGRAATMVYAGIRKLITCQPSATALAEGASANTRPTDGTEITYSQMVVSTSDDFDKLLRGDPVTVLYEE